MICRGLLLWLERAGEIQLPSQRFCPARNPLVERKRPEPLVPDNRPVWGPLASLMPLEIQQVRRSSQEGLFQSLVEQYRYLRYQTASG
jgi:hypothetical protein